MTRYNHLITDENRKWWTLGAMCFALFMIMLDNTVVNVALPSIQKDLGASISGLEWTINGYTLSFAVLLATGGRLGDIFGRRRMFLFGVVIFTLSSATAGFAGDATSLVVSRIVQGVGAALMMPATLSIITDAFPGLRARQGDGDVGGRLRSGPGRRPGAGRVPHRARQLAGDLLPQHPGRDRGRHRGPVRRARVARHHGRPRGRLRRRRRADRRPDGADPGPGRGQQLGLGLARNRRPAGRSRARARRLRRDRAAGQGADGRLQPALGPQLPRRGRGGADRLLRDARRLLLPRPLHAGHPRLLAAGGGGEVPALDPDDRRRGAGRGPALRSLRAALADRRRPGDRRRLALQLQRHRRSTPATSTCCPGSCCSASASR